ncbi:MAG: putative SOS response-associated peptidase YedK [Myxococcota bacterium]|jgi:putative SOS response-associated peptidase YedK
MCGRYSLTTRGTDLAAAFEIIDVVDVDWGEEGASVEARLTQMPSRYNVAPTQRMPVVQADRRADRGGQRVLTDMRWGLVPPGAPDLKVGARMINSRSETAHRLPAFRRAFREQRCIVPADGWYEWTKRDKVKDPWRFTRPDNRPFAMAGLFEEWRSKDGVLVRTFSVLTTEALPWAADIHHRMPVLLPSESYDGWLDPDQRDPEVVKQLIMPWAGSAFAVEPVSHAVNRVANDGLECLGPRAVQQSLFD